MSAPKSWSTKKWENCNLLHAYAKNTHWILGCTNRYSSPRDVYIRTLMVSASFVWPKALSYWTTYIWSSSKFPNTRQQNTYFCFSEHGVAMITFYYFSVNDQSGLLRSFFFIYACIPLIPMRTLELVQPFFTSFEFWDFFIFPPSYVVSKLSYSQRALGRKWGQ